MVFIDTLCLLILKVLHFIKPEGDGLHAKCRMSLIRGTTMISVRSDPRVRHNTRVKCNFYYFAEDTQLVCVPKPLFDDWLWFVALRKHTGSWFRPITEGESLRLDWVKLCCIDKPSTVTAASHTELSFWIKGILM